MMDAKIWRIDQKSPPPGAGRQRFRRLRRNLQPLYLPASRGARAGAPERKLAPNGWVQV